MILKSSSSEARLYNDCNKAPTKTWVDFTSVAEDVEKLEFPVPVSSHPQGELEYNSNQSQVFIAPLSDLNMLDHFEKRMVPHALKLPAPT